MQSPKYILLCFLCIPYSLDITPPLFISPPFRFARSRCEGIYIHRPSDWLRDSRLVARWWWCENCVAFLTTHCAFIDDFMFHCAAELMKPLQALSQAARAGDGQFCPCCFLHTLYGRINETNYHYSIISPPPPPPPHTCS